MSFRPTAAALATWTACAALYAAGATAAPGTLSQQPLFIGTQVDPNVVFLIDDSGSMDWEIVTTDHDHGGLFTGTQRDGSSPDGSGSVKHRDSQADGNENGSADCSFGNGYTYGYLYGVEFGTNAYSDDSYDCNTADEQAWRFRNSDFNPLYFNPAKSYTPWSGVDVNGDPFGDIDITNAPNDPYNPTEYIDLTRHNSDWGGGTSRNTSDRDGDGSPDGFRYYTWSDADGDGLFDNGEETEHLIKGADAATQQNFANWFSYYRSRMLMAKAAYGRVIAEADNLRVGLVTMNASSRRVAIGEASGDPASGHKRGLLDNLYSITPGGGTPLRDAACNCGRYLDCASNDYFGTCPALSAADGGQCQQNFLVMMTDGFYNGSFHTLGNEDGDSDTAFDGGAYADSRSDTLADIAMHFYERDLQPGLADEVPTITGIDEASHQHMVTYSVAYGVNGTLSEMPPSGATSFNWPNPSDGDAEKIDDLRHAAYNGRGLFLSAEDPNDLATALSDAISDIADRSGSAAAVAFNTTSLQTDTVVYVSLFNSTRWSGRLLAYPLDDDGQLEATAEWDAAEELDDRNLVTSPRTMLTYGASDGIPFTWDSLTTAQKNDLRTSPSGGTDSDTVAQARLDYLRGERSDEGSGNGFRIRSSRLGDIVHSAPVYVGAPELAWPDAAPFPTAAPYSQFKSARAGRQSVVYLGANDGMLHGFDATSGEELLAYIPGLLYSTDTDGGLHYLTDPGYHHRYYVDLSPTVSDVYSQNEWKTVLIGGLRAGGRGYFALDVTDPADFGATATAAADTVLWEFGSDDDADVGHSFSKPTVALLNNGKWGVIFGNGYNDAGSGEAQLFILYLDEGLDGTWSGGDYLKITTGVGSSADRNGLSSPAVIDLDGNGTADRIYAGDLDGNLWVFDLDDPDAANWAVAYAQGPTPKPLFTAPDGQAVTSAPVVTANRRVTDTAQNYPNVMVYFGTGQYLTGGDVSDTAVQSFYGIWDDGSSQLAQADLQEQVVTTDGRLRTISNIGVSYEGAGSVNGCFLDLPGSGERLVTDPAVRGELVYFNTLVPSGAACTGGGSSWLMSVNLESCGPPGAASFDANGDGVIDENDLVEGVAAVGEESGEMTADPRFLGDRQYNSTNDQDNPVEERLLEHLEGGNTGRLSWQELATD